MKIRELELINKYFFISWTIKILHYLAQRANIEQIITLILTENIHKKFLNIPIRMHSHENDKESEWKLS